MTRALAGNFSTNYIGGSWSNPTQDDTTRAQALALAQAPDRSGGGAGGTGGEGLLTLAMERLTVIQWIL